jgi:hypothetical protein
VSSDPYDTMSDHPTGTDPSYCDTRSGKWVKVVRGMIRDLEYGEVQLTVHRGEVVEVRKLEKIRFEDTTAPRTR